MAGICGMSSAETVTQKQAMQMAQTFFNEANHQVMAPVKMVYNGRHLTTNRLFVPFYVYNLHSGGFVIISAENKTYPILGYSLKESFDPNHIGEKEKALLSSYARDIEMIRYDSSVPEKAIRAWQNYPQYVEDILTAPYDATDPTFSMTEADERINTLIYSGKAEETASDIYSPEQWEEMVSRELAKNKSVAMAFINPKGDVATAIVYGRKGDYYRIELDRRNQWLMRLHPSEVMSGAQLADFSWPTEVPLPIVEERPFEFLDAFTAEVNAAETTRGIAEEVVNPQPTVQNIGGGHYAVTLPENVRLARVYSLGGALSGINTYRSTNTAHIDLSIEPAGFYFALLVGESGKPYGIKLTR